MACAGTILPAIAGHGGSVGNAWSRPAAAIHTHAVRSRSLLLLAWCALLLKGSAKAFILRSQRFNLPVGISQRFTSQS
jgi:hypothetical protein